MGIALTYHERTKHYYNRYAVSLGYLNWAHKPNPYRSYVGAKKYQLKIEDDIDLTYDEIFKNNKTSSLSYKNISSFFRYALGLAAVKKYGADQWELRINASSGNLHPTEAYAILPEFKELATKTALYHYHSYDHALEHLYTYEFELPKNSFIIVISSIIYREMWKYGERCYRYCALDLGHAYRAIEISAKLHGWKVKPFDFSEEKCEHLIGLDQKNRHEPKELESGDIALLVTLEDAKLDTFKLSDEDIRTFDNKANRLCDSYQEYEIVSLVDKATKKSCITVSSMNDAKVNCLKKATDIILQRRSAQAFEKAASVMKLDDFMRILKGCETQNSRINFILYVHNISGLDAGLYLYKRNGENISFKVDFLYEHIQDELYLLQKGDFRVIAKNLSCMQDIASDSAFAMSMLANFSEVAKKDIRYKELLFEAGRIGQQLYLDATASGFSATGIGCFYDDAIHNLLGIDKNKNQVVYNFTIGKAIIDTRLQTLPPYHHLKE